jgi:hypothetical protein
MQKLTVKTSGWVTDAQLTDCLLKANNLNIATEKNKTRAAWIKKIMVPHPAFNFTQF